MPLETAEARFLRANLRVLGGIPSSTRADRIAWDNYGRQFSLPGRTRTWVPPFANERRRDSLLHNKAANGEREWAAGHYLPQETMSNRRLRRHSLRGSTHLPARIDCLNPSQNRDFRKASGEKADS